mmetsp:Transcript_10685/g.29479  ORF Transcript_10685/g.29479 Transcript_10685/m.29479 type:complete len:201 (+) Transcript_10685:633-1235(+)
MTTRKPSSPSSPSSSSSIPTSRSRSWDSVPSTTASCATRSKSETAKNWTASEPCSMPTAASSPPGSSCPVPQCSRKSCKPQPQRRNRDWRQRRQRTSNPTPFCSSCRTEPFRMWRQRRPAWSRSTKHRFQSSSWALVMRTSPPWSSWMTVSRWASATSPSLCHSTSTATVPQTCPLRRCRRSQNSSSATSKSMTSSRATK